MPIQTRARVYDTPVAAKKKDTPSSSAKRKPKSQTVPEAEDTPDGSQLPQSPELGLGDRPDEQSTMGQAASSLSRSAKRKPEDEDASAAAAQDESPSTKKQKLAVRPKRSTPSKSHKSFSVEIPLSKLRDTKPEAEAADESSPPTKDEVVAETAAEVVTPAPSKSKRIIFSDDEPMEFYTPLEAPAKTPRKTPAKQAASVIPETVAEAEQEEEEESDDDEAPEAVSTHKPVQSNRVAQAAAKAAEQQAAEKKRKRQERDALFKQQAEVRKRAEEAKQPAEKASPEPDSDAGVADDEPAAAAAPAEAGDVARSLVSGGGGRKRAEKRSLPSILPAEFLESDEEDDEGALAAAGVARQPKKIKFTTAERQLARDGRPPADQRVGSTVYRVLHDKADKKLAPKLQKHSRNAKEELLRRNRVAQRKKSGFFVNK